MSLKVKTVTASAPYPFDDAFNAATDALDKAGHGIISVTFGFEATENGEEYAAFIVYDTNPYNAASVGEPSS